MKPVIRAAVLLVILIFLQDYFSHTLLSGITNIACVITFVNLVWVIVREVRKPAPEKAAAVHAATRRTGGWWLPAIAVMALALYIFRTTIGRYSYGIFVMLDNLLKITDSMPPAVAWGVAGLLAGAIYGSITAWKKYKLNFWVNAIPAVVFILFIAILIAVNNPFGPARESAGIPETGFAYVATAEDNTVWAGKDLKYKVSGLLDESDSTAWITEINKGDKNQQVTFSFNQTEAYAGRHLQCTGFRIRNGYRRSAQLWAGFARLKEFSVKDNDTFVYFATAGDRSSGFEDIRIIPVNLSAGHKLVLVLYSVYPGKKWAKRIAVTELVPIIQYDPVR